MEKARKRKKPKRAKPKRAKPKQVKSYQSQQKRRRSRALLTQACLGVMIVALLFGVSYACVQIVHGQPVLPSPSIMAAGSTGCPCTICTHA